MSLTLASLISVLTSVVDFLVVWLILYYVLHLVRSNSRTIQIFKGVVLIILIDTLSRAFNLKTVYYFANMFINWGFLALIIIFQPELRSMLEKIGKSNVFNRMNSLSGNEKEYIVDQLVTSVILLSKDKTGALISLERGQSMDEYIATGTKIQADISAEVLASIFVTTTPLHDGAVIIQGDKIACASAYFPPTSAEMPGRFGARHRAAVGISEVTDALTIVVSEETGGISITENGMISKVDERQLHDYLMRILVDKDYEMHDANHWLTPGKDDFTSLDNDEKMDELAHEADLIKLPQNHKNDRAIPSYPKRNKIAPVSVKDNTKKEADDEKVK